jgi:hypothetical protein
VKEELERVAIPGEVEAYGRTWATLEAAFAERQPVRRPSHWPRVAAIAVALAALLASAFSPPGQAVIDEIREVVGVERAERALFSLPTEGRLLVAADSGVWVVQQDGSKRLLGEYREASWSPFGRFVVAARRDELAALEPDGDVRWTLPRRGVRAPRWTGTETDTRIAYVVRTGIRIVAGDGTGDRLLTRRARGPLAWRPGPGFVLAYGASRSIRVVDTVTGRLLWQVPRPAGRSTIEWSSDGRLLLVLSPRQIRMYDRRGNVVEGTGPNEAPPHAAGARPGSRQFAVARAAATLSKAYVLNGRALFDGTGVFQDVEWSPGGRWVLVTWPTADQWVFVDASAGGKRIRAVSNIADQFRSRSFPRVEGWCCAP